jgi:ABC-2 type transport system permease protein
LFARRRGARWFDSKRSLDAAVRMVPFSTARRQLLLKDLKCFMRDVSQWSQLLLLVALVLVYLYNFSALDIERLPYMSGFLKNVYAFNLGMAGFVMATVAVRFVFAAVSTEGASGRPSGPRSGRSGSCVRHRCRRAISCGRSSGPGSCRSWR